MYYARTRRTAHLYVNCVGLVSDVRPVDIITEDLCLTCCGNIGTRHEASTWWVKSTPDVFKDCSGWARQMPICLHCRQHHLVRDV